MTLALTDAISDADGDSLTVSLVSASSRFSLTGETVTFVPNGFIGTDQAIYQVSDGKGGVALGFVIVNSAVQTVLNQLPEAKDYSTTLDSATQPALTIDLVALGLISDADGDNLTLTQLYGGQGHASIKNASQIEYVPASYVGLEQFSYQVDDGNGGVAIATISVEVSNDNISTPPALDATPQIIELDNGQSVSVNLNDSVTTVRVTDWSLTTLGTASHGTISNQALKGFDYQATSVGVDNISYRVSGEGLSDDSMIVVSVTDPNSNNTAPQANNVLGNTTDDTALTVSVTGAISDADGDSLTVSLVSASSRFSLSGTDVTFTPSGFVGTAQAIYQVEDGKGGVAFGYVIITSTDKDASNNAPVALDASVAMVLSSNSTLVINLETQDGGLISDVDGDTLSLTRLYGKDNRASIVTGSNSIEYIPADFRGVDEISYQVNDGRGGYAIATIKINVTEAALTGIRIIPSSEKIIPKGATLQYRLEALYDDNSVEPISQGVQWSAANADNSTPAYATIDTQGLATGINAGSVNVSASFMGFDKNAVLTVTAPSFRALSIEPSSSTIPVGITVPHQLYVKYNDGTSHLVANPSWSVENASLGAFNGANGVVEALAAGSTRIVATTTVDGNSVTAYADLEVTSETLTSFIISPDLAVKTFGESQQYQA
ncbi:Ig-like domain-containing protein, partial [Shewanella marina]|uniref:Ig-like domain-containing protein n=1 Tax=Shewanella marina TaxID=487319 RepID=UPI00277D1583